MDLTALILITILAMLFGAYLKDVIDNNGGDNKKLYKKKCPECGQYSYSVSKEGIWRCSFCGEDISKAKVERERGNNNGITGSDRR
jgi:ribosomal protein L37AE/L43A